MSKIDAERIAEIERRMQQQLVNIEDIPWLLAELKKAKAIVEKLAALDEISFMTMGWDGYRCGLCKGWRGNHRRHCPWVDARAATEAAKEQT